MDKSCKHCGTTENLITRKNKSGKIEIHRICKSCWYKIRHAKWESKTEKEKQQIKNNISVGTKKGMENMSEESLEKVRGGHQKFLDSITEEEKKNHYEKVGAEISTSLIKKWATDEEYRKNQIEVTKRGLNDRTAEQKQQQYKNISKANIAFYENLTQEEKDTLNAPKIAFLKELSKDEECKIKRLEKAKITVENRTEERKEEINKNMKVGQRKFLNSLTEEEKQLRIKNIIEKGKITISDPNWLATVGKEKSRKLSEWNLKRLEENARTGRCFQSKVERDCLEYLKLHIDPNIDHQKRYNNWMIDFYSPKYDLYIQLDGVFWHGLANYKEGFFDTKIGQTILKTKAKDELQDKTIRNLIRITDIQFKNNPKILEEKIKPKIMNRIMNSLY
jgi:hypothetical protein